LETKTINKIFNNLNGNNDGKDLIPFDVKFKTFSKLIYECATNDNADASLWSVLNQDQFKELIHTTCTALEQMVENIPIDCTKVNGRNDLINSMIESLNITDIIIEEYKKLDVKEM